jgi:hypothetical protein
MTRETTKDQLLDAEPPVLLGSLQGERTRALKKLVQLILEGLKHGFFECTVVCDVIKGQKRRLVIKAGVSHQFIIPLEEIEIHT